MINDESISHISVGAVNMHRYIWQLGGFAPHCIVERAGVKFRGWWGGFGIR